MGVRCSSLCCRCPDATEPTHEEVERVYNTPVKGKHPGSQGGSQLSTVDKTRQTYTHDEETKSGKVHVQTEFTRISVKEEFNSETVNINPSSSTVSAKYQDLIKSTIGLTDSDSSSVPKSL